MFKRVVACLLIVASLAVNFSREFILAGFEANQRFIAAKLCINRNKPMLHCNGKCYLVKKLKQEEESAGKEEQAERNRFQEALVSRVLCLDNPPYVLVHAYFREPDARPCHRSASIFQPPEA